MPTYSFSESGNKKTRCHRVVAFRDAYANREMLECLCLWDVNIKGGSSWLLLLSLFKSANFPRLLDFTLYNLRARFESPKERPVNFAPLITQHPMISGSGKTCYFYHCHSSQRIVAPWNLPIGVYATPSRVGFKYVMGAGYRRPEMDKALSILAHAAREGSRPGSSLCVSAEQVDRV